MRPGVDPGFLDFEGPERGALGAKSADGVESGEGRCSPSPVWGFFGSSVDIQQWASARYRWSVTAENVY